MISISGTQHEAWRWGKTVQTLHPLILTNWVTIQIRKLTKQVLVRMSVQLRLKQKQTMNSRLQMAQLSPNPVQTPTTASHSATGPPTRTGYTAVDQNAGLIQTDRIYATPPTPAHLPHRVTIPGASRDFLKENGMCGTSLARFAPRCSSSTASISSHLVNLDHAVAMLDDSYAFGPDNGTVRKFTPEMVKNPLYQPPVQPCRPLEPEFSPFWTSTDYQDILQGSDCFWNGC